MQGDDAELTAAVRAAQEGDEAAFRAVYRTVHPRLLGYVRTLVLDADAEDVASEAWLQIARDLSRFEGDADRFRGWAARIARNRALDHLRMRGRRPAVGGDESELAGLPAGADTADEALEALGTGRTMALISRLPRDQAEAVVLRVVVGLDAKSAAQVLGKRSGAVRTAAHRGLRKLAEMLEAAPEGVAESVPEGTQGAAGGAAEAAEAAAAGAPDATSGERASRASGEERLREGRLLEENPGGGPSSEEKRGEAGPGEGWSARGSAAGGAVGGADGSSAGGSAGGSETGRGSGVPRPKPDSGAGESRTRGMARGVTHRATRTLRET